VCSALSVRDVWVQIVSTCNSEVLTSSQRLDNSQSITAIPNLEQERRFESAYLDAANGLFAETDLLGSVGPFSLDDANVVNTSRSNIKTNYSVDLGTTFSGSDGTSFSATGSMAETPEPTSVLLLLTGVAMFLVRFHSTTKTDVRPVGPRQGLVDGGQRS
jgi:hypothetical protein